jgi:hypothetical protein
MWLAYWETLSSIQRGLNDSADCRRFLVEVRTLLPAPPIDLPDDLRRMSDRLLTRLDEHAVDPTRLSSSGVLILDADVRLFIQRVDRVRRLSVQWLQEIVPRKSERTWTWKLGALS